MVERYNEIKRILNLMAEEKIPFIILRSYDFLTDTTIDPPGEIDILVPYSAYSDIRRFFSDQMYYPQYSSIDCIFTTFTVDKQLTFHIQLEYNRVCNMRYLSYSEAAEFTTDVIGYPCLDGEGLLINIIIHRLLQYGKFETKHKEKLKDMRSLPDTDKRLYAFLLEYFTAGSAETILHCIKEGRYKLLEKRRFAYILSFLLKKPAEFGRFCTYIISKLGRLSKKGLVLAFIGVDGTGKTTLCQATINILRHFGYKTHYIYMGRVRAHVLPLNRLSKKIGVSQMKTAQPGHLYLLIRDFVYILDMFMRYLFLILPHKMLNYTVICDRYAYDMYLDRNQAFLSKWFLKYLYPRPEILVFLQLPEQEIIRRKNEYDSQQRKILTKHWQDVAEQFEACRLVPDNLEKNTFFVYNLIQKFRFEKTLNKRN